MDALSAPEKANGAAAGRLGEQLADGRPVAEHDHPPAGMRRRDPLDGAAQPPAEHLPRLGPGNQVPALLGE